MEIDKEKILELFDVLPKDWTDALAHTMVLLAYQVDAGEREHPNKPIRLSSRVMTDMLRRNYIVTIEEDTEGRGAREIEVRA